jgi:Uma2 family endonuclease
MATNTSLTAEQLGELAAEDDRYKLAELDEGELVEMAAATARHTLLVMRLAELLLPFVRQRSLGKIYGPDGGFVLARNPDIVVCPGVAFVRQSRVPPGNPDEFFPGAPDLAVEIFSKTDTVPRLMRKVRQYFRNGAHSRARSPRIAARIRDPCQGSVRAIDRSSESYDATLYSCVCFRFFFRLS